MEPVKIESQNIVLPYSIFNRLRGKEVRFMELENGILIQPIQKKSKLANLKRRSLIIGNSDELVDLKVTEWNEPDHL
jgi:hypothetical protein